MDNIENDNTDTELYILHMPLNAEGLALRIVDGNGVAKFVHCPLGQALLLPADVWHAGHYGGGKSMRLHGIFRMNYRMQTDLELFWLGRHKEELKEHKIWGAWKNGVDDTITERVSPRTALNHGQTQADKKWTKKYKERMVEFMGGSGSPFVALLSTPEEMEAIEAAKDKARKETEGKKEEEHAKKKARHLPTRNAKKD